LTRQSIQYGKLESKQMDPRVKPGGDKMSVFRFAPSPNGFLHLGHALSALLNADMAKAAGGRLLLRIEDIDAARCRPEYETAIYGDLAWLGIDWERPVRCQSRHYNDYRAALVRLEALGLIYPSFESRAEIARTAVGRDPDGAPLYAGQAKKMPAAERQKRIEAGEPYALRLDMSAALARSGPLSWQETGAETGAGLGGETGTIAADPAIWGDVILARKETPTSYHLSVVVDDAAQMVTDVVRGRDLFASTSVHRLLQSLLGLPAPRYHHHRLILGEDGSKLSKSTAATGLRELRARGVTAVQIRKLAGLD
jgi:glutamyl-Q tRNA(Asp) synthetase